MIAQQHETNRRRNDSSEVRRIVFRLVSDFNFHRQLYDKSGRINGHRSG